MFFAKAPVAQAQEVKSALIAAGVLDVLVSVRKEEGFILFPVRDAIPGFDYEEHHDVNRRVMPRTLKEALLGIIPDEQIDDIVGGYDIVGTIALIEVPLALAQYEEQIAAAVLESHPSVLTVLAKEGVHGGEYRTQAYRCVAGIDTRETRVIESGCAFLVDVEEVYYSVRLSTERLRIATLMRPGERVLILGAGAGPYTVVFSKKSIAGRVVGIEKNPAGHKYALENIKRNRCTNAVAYEGDGQDLSWLAPLELPFDRVVIPIPASPKPFELAALAVLSPKAVMHTYCFAAEHELPIIERELHERFAAAGWRAHLLKAVKAGNHKPRIYRYCLDIALEKR